MFAKVNFIAEHLASTRKFLLGFWTRMMIMALIISILSCFSLFTLYVCFFHILFIILFSYVWSLFLLTSSQYEVCCSRFCLIFIFSFFPSLFDNVKGATYTFEGSIGCPPYLSYKVNNSDLFHLNLGVLLPPWDFYCHHQNKGECGSMCFVGSCDFDDDRNNKNKIIMSIIKE